ncbi:MAG: nitroreductase family deazaflavin-dependent oxidoreductase [Geminicoccales bacterium]
MPLPDALARINRRVTNPLMRRIAGRAPLMAIVVHHGRRSGRRYETPVLAFGRGPTVTIALTYGADVDWLKNVRAADGCTLIQRGRARELSGPRMLPPAEGRRRMPALVRLILGLLHVDGFIELTDRERSVQSGGTT